MDDQEKHKYRIIFLEDDVPDLPSEVETLEEYAAFVIVTAPEETIDALRKQHFVERLKAPAPPPKVPEVVDLPTIIARRRERVPYIRVVRFRMSVRREWIAAVEATGCSYLQSLASRHIIVRCPDKPSLVQLEELAKQGAFVDKVEPYVPTIQLSTALESLLEEEGGEADSENEGIDKSAPGQASGPDDAGTMEGKLEASFFTEKDRDLALKSLKRQQVQGLFKAGKTLLIVSLSDHRNAVKALQTLAARRGLESLAEGRPEQPHNNLARRIIADRVVTSPPHSLGLNGQGEIVAVADSGLDTGDPNDVHADFQGRVIHLKSFPVRESEWPSLENQNDIDDGPADPTGHGTHVAGSILGDGTESRQLNHNPPIEGIAPRASLVFQAVGQAILLRGTTALAYTYHGIPDDLQVLFAEAFEQGARIHSNSWGHPGPGKYTPRSRAIDEFVWNHKDFLVIFSAGNEARGGSGEINHFSIGPQGVAKNALTVGASENEARGCDEVDSLTYKTGWVGDNIQASLQDDLMTDNIDDIAHFSSRGPGQVNMTKYEYRLKPDVVAPGTIVLSTRSRQINPTFKISSHPHSSEAYMYASGTSMAAPLVAGCAALVRQYLRENIPIPIANPSAALVKAILIHSARRPQEAPDIHQGWGRIDLQRVLNPLLPVKVLFFDDQPGLETGQSRCYKVRVSDTSVNLRATLVYTDAPGVKLQFNLNLLAKAPSQRQHVGNGFLNDGALDDVNNVEGIVVDDNSIESGDWTIYVVADSVPSKDVQDFALVLSAGALELLEVTSVLCHTKSGSVVVV